MADPQNPGSFVARFWLEGDRNNEPTWRGHIQHVQGEEQSYFQDFDEMKEFLERIGGVPLPEKHKAETDD